jgi:hypothetical protein
MITTSPAKTRTSQAQAGQHRANPAWSDPSLQGYERRFLFISGSGVPCMADPWQAGDSCRIATVTIGTP